MGGPGPFAIKISYNFCVFFKSLTYFTEVQWFISKKIIIFKGSRGTPTFFPRGGGSNFFKGGGGEGPIAYSL